MTNIAVVEVIVAILDYVLETYAHTNPTYELFHSDAPLDYLGCINISLL